MIFLRVEILIRNDADLAVVQYSVCNISIIYLLLNCYKTWRGFNSGSSLKKLLNQIGFTYIFRSTMTSACILKILYKM